MNNFFNYHVSFHASIFKKGKQHKLYTDLPRKYIKSGKDFSKLKLNSDVQSKVENNELRGTDWRFLTSISKTII